MKQSMYFLRFDPAFFAEKTHEKILKRAADPAFLLKPIFEAMQETVLHMTEDENAKGLVEENAPVSLRFDRKAFAEAYREKYGEPLAEIIADLALELFDNPQKTSQKYNVVLPTKRKG